MEYSKEKIWSKYEAFKEEYFSGLEAAEKPCDHPGCISHTTHPCEKCGTLWGESVIGIDLAKEGGDSTVVSDLKASELPSLRPDIIIVDDPIRGSKIMGQRPDTIIIDDLED